MRSKKFPVFFPVIGNFTRCGKHYYRSPISQLSQARLHVVLLRAERTLDETARRNQPTGDRAATGSNWQTAIVAELRSGASGCAAPLSTRRFCQSEPAYLLPHPCSIRALQRRKLHRQT